MRLTKSNSINPAVMTNCTKFFWLVCFFFFLLIFFWEPWMQHVDPRLLHHILRPVKPGNRFLYTVCSIPLGRTWSASTSSSTSCDRSRTFPSTSCRASPRLSTTTRTGRLTSTTSSKWVDLLWGTLLGMGNDKNLAISISLSISYQ